MAALLTLDELRVWTREPIDADDDIIFAEAVIDAASLRVAEEAGFADWLGVEGPSAKVARSIALQVARRTYLNPDQETRTAAIGPLGGVSYRDEFAAALELTQSELDRLAKIAAEEGSSSSGNGLFSVALVRDDPFVFNRGNIVLNDSSGSGIQYAHPDDAWAFGDQR